MREILFKAKSENIDGTFDWIEGYLSKCDGKWTICDDEGTGCFVEYETICQYTGLTDKAKNKAFENSIIKVNPEDEFGVINYGEYANPFDNSSAKHIGFYVEWQNKTRTNLWRKDLGYWLNDTTIICGNIFDNAELLEASCTNSRTGN